MNCDRNIIWLRFMIKYFHYYTILIILYFINIIDSSYLSFRLWKSNKIEKKRRRSVGLLYNITMLYIEMGIFLDENNMLKAIRFSKRAL